MTAAERITAAERWEAAHRAVVTTGAILVAIGSLWALGWCSGRRHERTVETAAHADSLKRVLADSAKAIEAREAAHTAGLLAAAAAESQARDAALKAAYTDSLARARRAAVRSTVVITSDTTVRVRDTSYVVPAQVTATITQDDATIAADSLALRGAQLDLQALGAVVDSLHLALADAQADAATWKQTAQIQAAQLAVNQPKHRFGFKTGAVVGGVLVAVIAQLVH